MLTLAFDFPRPISPRSRMAIFPTLSSKTTGRDASGVFNVDRPMHVPLALANIALQAPSLDANAGLMDVATTSDTITDFRSIFCLSTG
ncbi:MULTISPECIES: hypothetical protein [unclassified Rhizobium]|uniref:hypothetical protein n=1 Tax=unclassified Rhizobium TaxID=2613769 RepID=UPI001ADC6733|nr:MULTISPECIES: hypothetical protein [unclassified Rhizobium]MBO9127790.1 hypothetical protein [Rhizobium sp. 16-488-2b]MBO9178252.1 hypothetical protein [Rhizobium sp. 16-488-2a]